MGIDYRKLSKEYLETFIQMRITQLREEGAKEEIDLAPAHRDYYDRHMADGTFVSWIAFDGEKIIGTSGMSFVEKPPYFGCPSGKMGLLSSMYTDPDYRRKGIAKELLDRVVCVISMFCRQMPFFPWYSTCASSWKNVNHIVSRFLKRSCN